MSFVKNGMWARFFSFTVVFAFIISGVVTAVGSEPPTLDPVPVTGQPIPSYVPGTEWVKDGIVLDVGPAMEEIYVTTPSVIKLADGTYAMWYQGLGTDGHQRIMKAISNDGMSWTRCGIAINYGEATAEVGVQHPFVMIDSSGTYHMWYTGYSGYKNTRILHATSSDGATWAKLGPELSSGATYDLDGLSNPRVYYDGTQWHLWYSGCLWNPLRDTVCHAHKTLFSDPWIKDGTVLNNDGEFDNPVAWAQYVIPTENGYDMFYGGRSPAQYPGRICHAYSADGLSWTKTGIAVDRTLPGESYMTDFPSVIYENGAYRMWYVGYDGINSRIYHASTTSPQASSVDLSVSSGDICFSDAEPVSGTPVTLTATVHGDTGTSGNITEMTPVFSDDFDLGNLDKWAKSTWYAGSVLEVTTQQSNSPSYSFHAQSNPNTNSGPYIVKFFDDYFSNILVREQFLLPVKAQQYDGLDVLRIGSSQTHTANTITSGTYDFYVMLKDDDYSLDAVELVLVGGTWQYYWNMDICNLDPLNWYSIELELKGADYSLKVDNQTVLAGLRHSADPLHHIVLGDEGGLGGCWGDGYWDDVEVYSVTETQTSEQGEDATCTVSFYMDSQDPADLIGSVENVFVPADGQTPVSIDWNPVAGEHDIFVVVSNVNPTDSDLSNNAASVSISVIGTDVDLAIYGDDIVLPSPIVLGDQVTIDATVHNLGESQGMWEKQGVVLSPGISAQYPYVIKDGDIYKMWYTGFGTTPDIYYATSSDHVNWTNYGKVLTHPTGTTYAAAPSVIKETDGTYKMWYSCQNYNWNSEIYYATSTNGISWTQLGKVLPIGPAGSFDSVYACQGYVFKDAGTYKIYYKAYDSALVSRFGLATSPDGITWTKYGAVMNVPAGYAAMECPFVLPNDDGSYDMWFSTGKIFKATSNDGITWGTAAIDLDVTPGGQDSHALYTQCVLREAGNCYMYYSGDSGSTSYIFLAEMIPVGQDATCTVSFYLDSLDAASLIGSVDDVFVPAGGETQVSIDWTAVAGEHEIIVVVSNVDPADSDLSNNAASKNVTVCNPVPAALAVTKVRLTGPAEGVTHTYYEWELLITVTNTGGSDATDVMVMDVLPAELGLLLANASTGDVSTEQPGTRSALPPPEIYPVKSTHIFWTVGDMAPGQSETLYLKVCTRLNPAGKQEFTSAGTYIINEGAYATGMDSSSGAAIESEPAPPITVLIAEREPVIGLPPPRPHVDLYVINIVKSVDRDY